MSVDAIQPAAAPGVHERPAGIVPFDTPCRACMYSLRAMRTDGRCPECGTWVAASTGPEIIARCATGGVRHTVGAIRGVLWATLLLVAVIAAGALVPLIPIASYEQYALYNRVHLFFEAAAALVLAWAHWRLGRPIPEGDGPRRTARRHYRAAVGLTAVFVAINAVLRGIGPAVPGVLNLPMTIAAWCQALAFAAALIAFMAYARELARRVPNDRLARAATVTLWVCGLSLAAYLSLALWVQVTRPYIFPPWHVLIAGLVAIAVFLGGVSAAMVILHRLRVWYTRAARASAPEEGPEQCLTAPASD